MNESPFFSVVIPTYNCADFLERSLGSVLNQTFQDFEIHVIDNSSTDHTLEVVQAVQKKNQNICLHIVQNNGVIAYSRNVGIKAAKGKWIAFLDADDVWLPEKLQTVYTPIIDNPDVILICHDEWLVVDGVRKNPMRLGHSTANIYERILFQGFSLFTSAVSVRKDIALKTGGFSEKKEFVTEEDTEYWLRLSREGRFYFVDIILGEWHIHGSNASKNAEIHAHAIVAVGEYYFKLWLQEYNESQDKVRLGRGRTWTSAGRYLLKEQRFSLSTRYAMKAISIYPFNWKAWVLLLLSLFHVSF